MEYGKLRKNASESWRDGFLVGEIGPSQSSAASKRKIATLLEVAEVTSNIGLDVGKYLVDYTVEIRSGKIYAGRSPNPDFTEDLFRL